MQRLFLIADDNDFAEWIIDELSEFGRFVRTLDSMDYFMPQWNATGADVIILPESVIKSDESFWKIYFNVKKQNHEVLFLIIYHRNDDEFIEKLRENGNICVSYNDLDTGLLEQRLRFSKTDITKIKDEMNNEVEDSVTSSICEIENEFSEIKDINESENLPATVEGLNVESHILPDTETTVLRTNTLPKKKKSAEEQKAKLNKIKDRFIIEEKIIKVSVPVHHNSILVSVISLYPRAGATFVVSNFARMLGENNVPVTVLEPPSDIVGSTIYEVMHGDENAPKEWMSWSEELQLKGHISQSMMWSMGGVNWVPASIEPVTNWADDQTLHILLAARKSPVTICDISSRHNEPHCKKIMSMSDEVWIVADGDPIQLNHHFSTIDKLRETYPEKKLKVIGNKWNEHIKDHEWKEAVSLPVITYIPDLGTSVYKHLWNGNMAWDDSKLKNSLVGPFKPLVREIVSKEIYYLFKKEYGLKAKVNGILGKFKLLDDESKNKRS
ncbi:MAG: hypothetical protein ACE3L7_14405 [Candidatus Pristimantibacillus sp.]